MTCEVYLQEKCSFSHAPERHNTRTPTHTPAPNLPQPSEHLQFPLVCSVFSTSCLTLAKLLTRRALRRAGKPKLALDNHFFTPKQKTHPNKRFQYCAESMNTPVAVSKPTVWISTHASPLSRCEHELNPFVTKGIYGKGIDTFIKKMAKLQDSPKTLDSFSDRLGPEYDSMVCGLEPTAEHMEKLHGNTKMERIRRQHAGSRGATFASRSSTSKTHGHTWRRSTGSLRSGPCGPAMPKSSLEGYEVIHIGNVPTTACHCTGRQE